MGEGRGAVDRGPSEVLRTGLTLPVGAADAFNPPSPTHLGCSLRPPGYSSLMDLRAHGPQILLTLPSDPGPGQAEASSSMTGLSVWAMSLQSLSELTWYPGSLVNPLFTAFPAAALSPHPHPYPTTTHSFLLCLSPINAPPNPNTLERVQLSPSQQACLPGRS